MITLGNVNILQFHRELFAKQSDGNQVNFRRIFRQRHDELQDSGTQQRATVAGRPVFGKEYIAVSIDSLKARGILDMTDVAVAVLYGSTGICGSSLAGVGKSSGIENVESCSVYLRSLEISFMLAESGLDGINLGLGAADYAEAVAFFPCEKEVVSFRCKGNFGGGYGYMDGHFFGILGDGRSLDVFVAGSEDGSRRKEDVKNLFHDRVLLIRCRCSYQSCPRAFRSSHLTVPACPQGPDKLPPRKEGCKMISSLY